MNRLLTGVAAHRWPLAAGVLMGGLGAALAYLGNPVNSGICISCFLENAVGALALHPNPRMQYMRPELLGFFLGSLIAAVAAREYRAAGRGNGLLAAGLGFLMALGSAAFIGCPIKAVLRLAAGDLTSLAGVIGLIAGVWGGAGLLRGGGFGLEHRRRPVSPVVPLLAALAVVLATALLFVPGVLQASRVGAGSRHAPVWVSLGAGLLLGAVCQRSRFCITGSIRDTLLTRSGWPVAALGLVLLAAGLGNFFAGQFRLGYHDQPGAHLEALWSGLGMALVGGAAVLAGGCPFRQLVRAGEGDVDALAVVLGLLAGAVVVQTWGLGGTTGGVPAGGKVAVLLGLAAVCSLGLFRTEERE